MTFARRLALLAGVVLPLGDVPGEARSGLGVGAWAFLGRWKLAVGSSADRYSFGRSATLAAAWGFTLAIATGSFFAGLFGDPDPTGASRAVVVTIKAAMLAMAIAALVSVLRWRPAR